MDNIVIIGASGHAKVVIDIVEKAGRYVIAGLVDRRFKGGEELLGYPWLGTEDDLPALVISCNLKGVIVAVGDNYIRSKVTAQISRLCPDLPFVSAVHPSATVAREVSIGDGSVVMAGVIVNPGCSIGRSCILNTGAALDHDSIMEDFSSLAPRAATGGNCRIGYCAAISIGSVLIHGIQVGEHTVVGAGSTVLENIGSYCVAYGTPAREIRKREAGEKYL